MNCPLCQHSADEFETVRNHTYYRCPVCGAVFLDINSRLSIEDEERRYRYHNNDVGDPGYIKFVSPITAVVTADFKPGTEGLDFGAGSGPVIAKILMENGYKVSLYDPFFHKNPEALQREYDFIVCCEVMEHFHNPGKEFALLNRLLKPGGRLYCMTEILTGKTDFGRWYYKDDPTHVFFYRESTVNWIRENLNFSSARIENRLIVFTK